MIKKHKTNNKSVAPANSETQSHWAQSTYLTPWYDWSTNKPTSRGKSEENPLRHIPFFHSFRRDLREYLLTSTLHGLRFFWLAAFGSSIICASFFILNVYAKWRMSPMIVSINPENMPLSKLPFPAITICNVNQAKKSVAERIKKSGDSIDKKLLESLCSTQTDADIFEDEIAESANWDYTRSFLINVTQPCNEMLSVCIWNSAQMSCQDLFNAQLTDEGLCCTFNVVHREKMFRNPKDLNDMNFTFPLPSVDWTAEKGYPDDTPDDGFPWRPKGIGTDHGLTLVLDANLEEYYCASTKSNGFKILLHNPTETPNIAKLGEVYGPGLETRVAIEPRILDAQSSLEYIDVNKRLCLFSREKDLVFYRTYSLRNCEMECESRNVLDVCKCVLYYMPKNKSTRVCGKADAKCYSNLKTYVPQGLERGCDECLPACTEISYSERPSSAPLNKALVERYTKSVTLSQNRSAEYFTENMLIIHFYFEDNSFMRYTKGEIFGLTEFLSSRPTMPPPLERQVPPVYPCKVEWQLSGGAEPANTGGLLGLCMGFSMMSAVELLYYLTLRALCVARQRTNSVKPFIK